MNVEWCECWCGLSDESFALPRNFILEPTRKECISGICGLILGYSSKKKVNSRGIFYATVELSRRPWNPKIDPSKCKYCWGLRQKTLKIFIMHGTATKVPFKDIWKLSCWIFYKLLRLYRNLMLMEWKSKWKAHRNVVRLLRIVCRRWGWAAKWRQHFGNSEIDEVVCEQSVSRFGSALV